MRNPIPLSLAAFLVVGCSSAERRDPAHAAAHGSGHHHHGPRGHAGHAFEDAEAWTKVFDDPARDEWQRPEDVLRALELGPSMTVADIGAATGYFSVRLARAVPDGAVLATDIEPDMVRFLSERAQREGLTNLRAQLGTHTASGLAADSVDRILVVNVWHHLADPGAYALDLAKALRPGGRILVVDFGSAARRGPPAAMRVSPEAVIAAFESAGLSARVSPVVLPEQYIVEARKEP